MGLLDSNFIKNSPRIVSGTITSSSFLSSITPTKVTNTQGLQWMAFKVSISPYSSESEQWDCKMYLTNEWNAGGGFIDRYGNLYRGNIQHNGVYVIPTYGRDVQFTFQNGDGTTQKLATIDYTFLASNPIMEIKPLQLLASNENVAISNNSDTLAFSGVNLTGFRFFYVCIRAYQDNSTFYGDFSVLVRFNNEGGAHSNADTIIDVLNSHSVVSSWQQVRGQYVSVFVKFPNILPSYCKVYIFGVR